MFEIYKSQFAETKQILKDVEENIKRFTGLDPDEYVITSTGSMKFKNERKFGSAISFQQRKRSFTNRFGRQHEGKQENWAAEKEVYDDSSEEEDTLVKKPSLQSTVVATKRQMTSRKATMEQQKRDSRGLARFGRQHEGKQENWAAEKEVTDDSPEEEDTLVKKPSLQSTVVATKRQMTSRKATMEQQKRDSRGLARNKRMFGFVLGTLQQFQKEESQHKAKADKRAEIDKKLEVAAEKEKEQMKKEKEQMFIMRREKQILMRCLEKKMDIAKTHEVWEKDQKLLMNFIQTKTDPKIMLIPAKHNDKSKKRLQESQEKIVATVKAQRAKIELELSEIDQWYTRDDKIEVDDSADKESKLPDNSESQWLFNQDQMIKMGVSEKVPPVDKEKQAISEGLTNANDLMISVDNIEDMDQTESSANITGTQEDFEPIYDE